VRHALERASLLLLVGGAVFEFVTGILNIQIFYVFPFSFYTAHLYGAWVFIGAFVVHVGLKFPQMVKALRSRSPRRELRTGVAETRPEPVDSELVASAPSPATVSRRGLLGFVAGGSLTLLGLSFGQTIDGWWRRTALLAPHGRSYGAGPNDFQVNKTAAHLGITGAQTGPGWRLELVGPAGRRMLSRAELLGLPQHTYDLPIACVEGWSTDQTWTGVRLADLGRLVGAGAPSNIFVESLQQGGAFRSATLSAAQAADLRSLLALKVNGADLSADHGFPARVIVPAAPGVHNTKWVARVTVHGATT
jgi:DMSO/TMAO reductase YedYZ molybdopterin-dependent catalytic subunit